MIVDVLAEQLAAELRTAIAKHCLWPRQPAHAPLLVAGYFGQLTNAMGQPLLRSLVIACGNCHGIVKVVG